MTNLLNMTLPTPRNTLALDLQDLRTAAAAGDSPVIVDEKGVPTAWRLFAFGPLSITRGGQTFRGEFTEEAADAIMEYFGRKGGKIPLDSRHFLFRLAEKLNVSEREVAEMLPDGRGTFGYAALEKREDGLWVTDVEYVPMSYRLMAEGVFRYFSPVIRGLQDGRLRVTSVAFTNEPALDGLDSLAAEADEGNTGSADALAASLDAVAVSVKNRKRKEEAGMKKLLEKLAPLLGMDTIALSEDSAVPEDVVRKMTDLAGEIKDLRRGRDVQKAFLGSVSDCLALGEDADLKSAEAAILGLHAKAGQADGMKVRLDALELEAETRKRDEVIARGVAEGKLTKAMIDGDWCKGQDAAALSAFLKTAPVVVPVDRVRTDTLQQPDAVALSDDQRQTLTLLGVTDEEQQKEAAKL